MILGMEEVSGSAKWLCRRIEIMRKHLVLVFICIIHMISCHIYTKHGLKLLMEEEFEKLGSKEISAEGGAGCC